MEFNKGYGSYTHQPVIKGVLDLYKPQSVVELGIGMYSTPLFNGLHYLGVENNKEWIDFVNIPDVIYHELDDVMIDTHWNDLSEEQKIHITDFYLSLNRPAKRPSLLFVDNYASCRIIALNTLQEWFDIIIFHDCEPDAVKWYSYNLLHKSGFMLYYLTSYESWTGLMVRFDYGYERIKDAVDPYIKELEERDGDLGMQFIKDNNHI